MMWKLAVVAVGFAACVIVTAGSAQAGVIYDFNADYSEGSMGPTWNYRSVDSSGNMADMTWGTPLGLAGWEVDATAGIVGLSGQVYVLPGLGDLPIVQFIAPTDGWYEVQMTVSDANSGTGDGIFATLSQGATGSDSPFNNVLASGAVNLDTNDALVYTNTVFLGAGGALNVVVDLLGNPNGDATILNMIVTDTTDLMAVDGEGNNGPSVPEPGTLLLLGAGLLGVARKVRRKNRSAA